MKKKSRRVEMLECRGAEMQRCWGVIATAIAVRTHHLCSRRAMARLYFANVATLLL